MSTTYWNHLSSLSPTTNILVAAGFILSITPLASRLFPSTDDQRRPAVLSHGNVGPVGAAERVLILGASSGCGEELAYRYAKRGAKLCLVARREAALETVASKCRDISAGQGSVQSNGVLSFVGDVSSPGDMVRIREAVIEAWGGVDTVHIISGVTSTEPLLQGAGVKQIKSATSTTSGGQSTFIVSSEEAGNHSAGKAGSASLPTEEGLKSVLEDARKCADVNIYGMVNVTACFVPLLASSSKSPLIHHLSSVAALIPAPTRSLYAATKSGGLAMFRSVAAEVGGTNGVGVRFLAICPGTIDTDFRRNSISSKRGIVSAEGYDKKTLTVDQTIDSILHHCDLPPRSVPLSLNLFKIKFQIPFLRVAPSDVVFLPEMPYRLAYWLLDTPLRSIVAKMGRKKYQLE